MTHRLSHDDKLLTCCSKDVSPGMRCVDDDEQWRKLPAGERCPACVKALGWPG